MFALLLKEIRSFLSSLTGYIVIAVFLLLMGLFLWVFNTNSNIFKIGEADLYAFFDISPLIFLFLIPAITMRLFAEEKRTGTIELLFTRPLTDMQIILAKYFAGLVLVIFSLLPTLVYYYSVYQLGQPVGNVDSGAVWGSYAGLLLLGAGFVSIGVFSSSITQNQIVAFIIGVFLCFFFFLGFEFIGSYSLFGKFDLFIKNLGINAHYHSLARGVIDTRDLLYFAGLVAFFLLLTRLVLESRKKINFAQFLLAVMMIFVLNFIGSFKFYRWDLTAEKRHSLSASSIAFLEEKLDDVVHFKIYLTGELPSDLKRIERQIGEKLDEMKAYANDYIEYSFFDPYSIESESDRMAFMQQLDAEKNIKFSELEIEEAGKVSFKYLFPGATVTYKGLTVDFNFFQKPYIYRDDPNTQELAQGVINNLEYQLMDALRKVTRVNKPRIAILEGHGEADMHELGIITNALSEYYVVERVSIDNKINAIRDFNLLMVVKPTQPFSEKDKFVIDQFVMKGGKVAWFIDALYVPQDTLFKRGQTMATPYRLNLLEDMLFTYGARINNNLLLDKQSAPIDIPGYPNQFHEWYFFPLITPERNHPVTRNIDPVRTQYANSIDLVGEDPRQKKTILLKTSASSLYYPSPARVNYGVIEMEDNLFRNPRPHQPVAVLIEGPFTSVFKDRLSPAFTSSTDYITKDKVDQNKMLIVADGNIPVNEVDSVQRNGIWEKRYRKLHHDKYGILNPDGTPRFHYGNKEFVLNAIDYLIGDDNLIDIRQRSIAIRRLNEEKILEAKAYWQFLNVVLPVIILILLGILQFSWRKRKYGTKK